MSGVDHRELLRKYIHYVLQAEGTDFILIHDRRYKTDAQFTEQEWEELRALASAPEPA